LFGHDDEADSTFTAERAPEPDDILFENLEVFSRHRENIVIKNWLLVVFILAAIYALTTFIKNWLQSHSTKTCDEDDDSDYCECYMLGLGALKQRRCRRGYIGQRVGWTLLTALAGSMTSGANLWMKRYFRNVSLAERQELISKQAKSEMQKVFLAQFVNSTILIVLSPWFLRDRSMFDKEWYVVYGMSVLVVLGCNAVFDEVDLMVKKILRLRFQKRSGVTAVTQQVKTIRGLWHEFRPSPH
jgi:hypothetical protein